MARGIEIKVGLDTSALGAGIEQIKRGFKSAADNVSISINKMRAGLDDLLRKAKQVGDALSTIGTKLSVGLTLPLAGLGAAAVKSALELDKLRTTMVALTGSTEKANAKIAELRKLAEKSPGVTTSFAVDLFNQLKALNTIAEPTINKVIQSVGRLNAVFTIDSPKQFARNLTQIFSGGFERDQIKEALQQVPIFEQILESAFGTKDPDKLRKLKDAGKLTIEGFLGGLSDAVNRDPRFANITDTIAGKLAKGRENIINALAPVGTRIIEIVLPVLEQLTPKILGLLDAFAKLSPEMQQLIIVVGGLALALGPVLGILGNMLTLLTQIRALGGISAIFGALGSGGIVAGIAAINPVVLALTAAVTAGAIAWTIYGRKVDDALALASRTTREPLPGIPQPPAIVSVKEGTIREGFITPVGDVKGLEAQITGRPNRPSASATPLPKPTGGGSKGGSSAAAAALAEAKAVAEAQLAIERAKTEGIIAISRAARDEVLATLKDQRDRGLITVKEFYDEKFRIALANIDAERDLLVQEIKQLEEAFNAAKGSEKLQIQAKLTEAYSKQEILLIKLTAAQRENFEEFKKATELPDLLDVEPVKVAADNMERLGQASSQTTQQLSVLGTAFNNLFSNTQNAIFGAIDNLTRKLGLFGSFVGDILKGISANIVTALFGGSGAVGAVGGGGGGFLGGLLGPIFGGGGGGGGGILGGLFGGGGGGGLFRTPGINPNAGGSALSSGLSATSAIPFLGSGVLPRGTGFGGILPTATTGLSKLLGGLGFGASGPLGAGALALPLLGGILGAGVGGTSTLGKILGGVGGAAVGLGAAFGGAVFGAGGGFLAAGLAALGPAAIIGAPLLIGAFLLGKASQRRKDEAASGEFLTQALAQIRELKRQVGADQIDGGQAKSIFENQILAQFISQINTLKTKSVRESRLTNQVRDLRAVFDAELTPEIEAQRRRRRVNTSLIPEFAIGGVVQGRDRGFDSVMALLRPGEMVLTQQQQGAIAAMAGAGVFQRAGVPDAGIQTPSGQAFAFGGTAQAGGDLHITFETLTLNITEDEAERIVATGGRMPDGRQVIIGAVRGAQKGTRREL